MNGHRLLLFTPSFEAHDPPHTMGLVNLFLFNKFRTCVRDRSALKSFRFMHQRTTFNATEGWGSSVLSTSHQLALSCEGSRITSHPLSSLECAVPRFRALSALECAVTKTRLRNSFRMRSSEKGGGEGQWVLNSRRLCQCRVRRDRLAATRRSTESLPRAQSQSAWTLQSSSRRS